MAEGWNKMIPCNPPHLWWRQFSSHKGQSAALQGTWQSSVGTPKVAASSQLSWQTRDWLPELWLKHCSGNTSFLSKWKHDWVNMCHAHDGFHTDSMEVIKKFIWRMWNSVELRYCKCCSQALPLPRAVTSLDMPCSTWDVPVVVRGHFYHPEQSQLLLTKLCRGKAVFAGVLLWQLHDCNGDEEKHLLFFRVIS